LIEETDKHLERRISYPFIFFIIINSILGTGVFLIPGILVGISQSYSVISWILIGLYALLLSSMFGELVERHPFAGGVYEFTKQAYGIFPSFIVGWIAIIMSNLTIAMLVVGGIKYLNPSLPSIIVVITGLLIIWGFTIVSYIGIKTSISTLLIFAAITTFVILFGTGLGFSSFHLYNFIPNKEISFLAILFSCFLAADTFFGWESATYLSEEIINPREVLPRALRKATIVVFIMVTLMVIALIGSLGIGPLSNSITPLVDISFITLGPKAARIVSLLIYLAIMGSVADLIVSSPRLLMAMARDKEMVTPFADLHPKYKTPYKAIIFQGLFSSILLIVGIASYRILLETLLPFTIILYTIMAFVLLSLRKKEEYKPKYPVFFGNKGLYIIITINILLISIWAFTSKYAGFIIRNILILIFFAIPLYLLLNSYYNPDLLRITPKTGAMFRKFFERLLLPKRLKKEILMIFQDLEGKNILELGSGIGSLTLPLSKEVGKKGLIYAVDISKENLNILQERLRKEKISHVQLIHDPHIISRIHPAVGRVDVVFSIGLLGYFSDMKRIVKDLYRILPQGGRICFIDYVDFFKIFPNADNLRDIERIKKLFKEEGFIIRIKKIRGIFWNYLFIYGIKAEEGVMI